jgi:DNA modification methylase
LKSSNTDVAELMQALRAFLKENDMMAYLTMMANRLLELHRVLKDTGSLYLHCDPTASHYLKLVLDGVFGKENYRNEIVWAYKRWSAAAQKFQGLHDVIFFYTRGKQYTFNKLYDDYTEGTLKRWKGIKRKTTIASDGTLIQVEDTEGVKGSNLGDVWNISILNSQSTERLGYPTQKPLALLERIISASSNEGDVVLDPFCGCGTAVHAAEKLKRQWIGIDITHLSVSLIEKRMKQAFSALREKGAFEIIGTPQDFDAAKDLSERDKYQFQFWACTLVGAQPYKGGKKGADGGIDGLIFPEVGKSKTEKIIVSVKGGANVGRAMIAQLKGDVEREKAAIGLFITLTQPTKEMVKEAAAAGHYESPHHGDFPKIQILTIEGLLNGTERAKFPDMSFGDQTFKAAKAEKKNKKSDQTGLFE